MTQNDKPKATATIAVVASQPGNGQQKKNKKNRKNRKSGMVNSAQNAFSKTNKGPTNQGLLGPKANPATQALHKHACTIVDPFCAAAKGTLYPDKTSGQRLAFQCRGLIVQNTDATGNLCIVLTPTIGNAAPGYAFVTSSGGNFTLPAVGSWNTYAGASTAFGYGSNFRIVSWGAIVRNNAPVTSTSGYVVVSEYNDIAPAAVIAVGNLYGSRAQVRPLAPGQEVSWVSSPEEPAARLFRAWDTTTVNVAAYWTSLAVQIVGGSASIGAVSVEYFINVEVLVDSTNAISQLLPPAPKHNPAVTSVASDISSGLEGFVEGGVNAVEKTVANLASTAIKGLAGGPLGFLAKLF
jgi:hypothetical protein